VIIHVNRQLDAGGGCVLFPIVMGQGRFVSIRAHDYRSPAQPLQGAFIFITYGIAETMP
jgi:hypothetical protein